MVHEHVVRLNENRQILSWNIKVKTYTQVTMDDSLFMAISHSPAELNVELIDFIYRHLTVVLSMNQSMKRSISTILHLNVQSPFLTPTMLVSKFWLKF